MSSSSTGAGGVGGDNAGAAGGFGAAGAGGVGGNGGSPGVVGCEKLVLHPEPLVIPDGFMGYLLPIDGQELAVLYMASSDVPDKLWDTRSRRLLSPFDTWPPPLSDALIHGSHQLDTQTVPHARRDGAFGYSGFEGYAVGSFYDAAVDVRGPANAYPILEPAPGEGVYFSDEGTLTYYPTLDAAEPSASYALSSATSFRTHGLGLDGPTLLLQDGDSLLVNSGEWAPFATAPENSNHATLFPRPGGFYWRAQSSATLYPYKGAQPLPPIKPFGDVQPGSRVDAASFRNGAVVATITLDLPGGNNLLVAVTDEVNTTITHHDFAEVGVCMNGISVVGSPDGTSVYVGYVWCTPPHAEYVVRRFDCVSE